MRSTTENASFRSNRRAVRMAMIAIPTAAALLLGGCTLTKPDTTVTQTAPQPTQSAGAAPVGPENGDQVQPEESTGGTGRSGGTGTSGATEAAGDPSGQATPSDTISPPQAAAIALDAHPGTQVFSIELDRVHGVTAWEVEVGSTQGKWEVSVDVVTGQIVKDGVDHSDNLRRGLALLAQAKVGYQDALATMLAAVPGGRLLKIDIDDHRGGAIWEGEILGSDHSEHEIDVEAITGQIIKHEIDH